MPPQGRRWEMTQHVPQGGKLNAVNKNQQLMEVKESVIGSVILLAIANLFRQGGWPWWFWFPVALIPALSSLVLAVLAIAAGIFILLNR